MKIEPFDQLYAVTEDHYVIPLTVIRVQDYDGGAAIRITTKISAEDPTNYAKAQHCAYFQILWASNNKLENHNVFRNPHEARSHAIHNAELAANELEAELRTVRRRIGELFIQKFAEGLPK